ncbi:fibroblast growth factor receptor-like 1 isoform X2 [Mercenaria mercenaria]|uniref:fibroblast growth factor receptor-like 1 isoform X2 n=1 Tax=Mercenaria mercenaria TaxID=6596 RepID=UPI00234F2175|nr:fibroblast growth factor receptor-like 1 isoform X2 [Mercenaria mercenaria]
MYRGYLHLNLALVCLLVALCSAVGPPKQVGLYQARQVAKVGQGKKRFACPVQADPVPIVQWLKDGETITEMWEPRYRITKKEGALRIKDIELDDAGLFVCKATNGFGSINVNFSLIVVDKESGLVKQGGSVYEPGPDEDLTKEGGQMKTKPVLIGPHPLNETVTLGGYASFQCKVKSQVQPHIQWLKRLDKELEATVNSTNIIEVKGQKFVVLKTGEVYKDNEGFYVNKLVIKNVLGTDVGMYICLGANTMGYSFRSAFLTIVADDSGTPLSNNPSLSNSPGLSSDPHQRPRSEISSSEEVGNGSLPLIIAIPACVAIVLVTLAIFILKKRKRCNNNSNARRNTRFNAVPTQERENFTPAVQYPHILPPKGPPNRSMDKASTKHSSDFYSDISSVSRCHHHPQQAHSNHQYGY